MAAQTRTSKPRTDAVLELGSFAIASAGSRGEAAPSGTVHLVDGWQPVCGGERVRFIFPGQALQSGVECPACAAKVAQPVRRVARASSN